MMPDYKPGYTKTINATAYVERCQAPACDGETKPTETKNGREEFITLRVMQVKGEHIAGRDLLFCDWECVADWARAQ